LKGTLLNTGTVAVGATIGAAAGDRIPDPYKSLVLSGLGLVTMGLGMRLFFQSKNVLIVAAAVALGGVLGMTIGIQNAIESLAVWMKARIGGEGRFVEAIVTPSILFCVGPTTLLGCLQDGLEGKIDLLALKSTLDLSAAMFLAASLGWGVVLTALIVLIFQGILTLSAKPLRNLASDQALLDEMSAAGGILMLSIGLGLLEIKKLPTADYLPAIFLAPTFIALGRSIKRNREQERAKIE